MDWSVEFERCRPFLEPALARAGGTHTIEDVRAAIANRYMQFWPGARAAIVTEVQEFPQLRIFNAFLAGGDLDEILAMEPSLCSFGRYLGCQFIKLSGRRGWARVLNAQGWKEEFAVLAKSLGPPQEPEGVKI